MEPEKLIINSRDELLRMDTSKIVYFEADGNYTSIIMTNNHKFSLCTNLSNMEKLLGERLNKQHAFVRLGKSFIINLDYVSQVSVLRKRLVLTDFTTCSYTLDVSKEALKKLKDIIVKIKI